MIEDKHEAFETMNKLVDTFEHSYGTNWKLPSGEKAVDDLMNGIVVFKIVKLEFDAKFKLSQKQSAVDRKNVIAQLRASDDQTLVALADKMAAVDAV